MNFPTQLTVSRIVLTFLIVWLLFQPGIAAKAACVGLFAIASFTDWLDGFLARRQGSISKLGILLDPIADKVLVLGVLVALIPLVGVPAWFVGLIALREALVTGVRLIAARRGLVIPAAKEGKYKAVFQMLAILIYLVLLAGREIPQWVTGCPLDQLILLAAHLFLITAVALTLVSGVSFLTRAYASLFRR